MIYLVDNSNDNYGHFNIYRNTLLSIDGTTNVNQISLFKKSKNVLLKQVKWCFDFIHQLKLVPKESVAHFLYGDCYYAFSWLYFINKKRRIIVTMHSCPEGKTKRFLLKIFCKKMTVIIVHSEYTRKQYCDLGINNIEYIDYPSFYDYSCIGNKEQVREKYQILKNKIVISALGGTRYDKGLDILLEAFQYMDEKIKEKMILNIAGIELSFDENYIKEQKAKHQIPCRLTLKGLSDEEFMENVLISDFLVFPYRKTMTGNSGPMTEAVINEIPCIVADYGNIAAIAKEKNIGVVFNSESPIDLANIISKCVTSPPITDFSYKKVLSVNNFIKLHEKIYNNI